MAAALAAVLVTGYVADGIVRGRETTRLLAAVAEGQSSVGFAERRISATIKYTLPLLQSATAPARVRDGLGDLVEEAADGQVPALIRERDRVARLSVLPWHRDLLRARDAYRGCLDAHLQRLRDGAVDVRVLLRSGREPAASCGAAERALLSTGTSARRVRAALATT